MRLFQTQNAPKSTEAEALPQTPLGELTALPRPYLDLWGKAPRERGGKGWIRGEGERREGRGLAPWAQGDRHP